MIKTVFSVITNEYDHWHPQRVTSGWNYLMFTDNPHASAIWRVIPISGDSLLLNRKIKILRQHIKADISIYIDGSFEIIGDLNEFLKEINYRSGIMACKHPHRGTLREEHNEIIKRKKASIKSVNDIRLEVKDTGKKGLSELGVLITDKTVPSYYFARWFELCKLCPRDQASFDYVFRGKVKRFPIEIRNKYFRKHKHK